jgi:LCP family protein required for cell wall assembly
MRSNTDTYSAIEQVPPPHPPRRKRRLSGFKKFVLFVLVAGIVGVFGAIGYIAWAEGKIDRIPSTELTSLSNLSAPTETLNFLIVGTDDRSNLPDEWEDHFGSFAGKRADVIMYAHMVPGERIQLLSIPRDLRVSIPGAGTNRINAAYVVGGPDMLVQVLQEEIGIPVHHYVEIDFGGFGKVVDSLGGVTIDFPYASRDAQSGLDIEAGTQKLDGEMALAYARSRHMQIYRDGQWNGAGGGDIARTGRQQELLIQLFSQVTSPSSAFNLPGFLPTFADQITADEGLGLGLMADLARQALGMETAQIESATLPVRGASSDGGRSYVVPTDEAPAVIQAFLDSLPFPATAP